MKEYYLIRANQCREMISKLSNFVERHGQSSTATYLISIYERDAEQYWDLYSISQ